MYFPITPPPATPAAQTSPTTFNFLGANSLLAGQDALNTTALADAAPADQAAMYTSAAIGSPVDGFTTLSPDSLMAYCEAQLDGVTTQVTTLFQNQQTSNSEIKVIQDCADFLKKYSNADQSGQTVTDMKNEMQTMLQEVTAFDPNSSALAGLTKTVNDFTGNASDGGMAASEIDSFAQQVGDAANGLTSDSSLEMVQLQSLMSTRQQVITLTTNMVQSIGDEANKIADNIGK